MEIDEVFTSTKRIQMWSMMSPTSSMWDSTNNLAMSRRKSSHEAKVGRHNVSYYTELEASMAGHRSIESTVALGGVVSSRVVETTTEAAKDIMSPRKGGIFGSPYASQISIQKSWRKFP